jgi:hypothetical protein
LNVISNICQNENNLLFDYDSKDYYSFSLSIKGNGFLIKKRNKLTFTTKREELNKDTYVASIRKNEDEFYINTEEELKNPLYDKNLEDKLWIVLRNTKFKDDLGYRLREGDKIKFGKVVFKVCELNCDKDYNRANVLKNYKSTSRVPPKRGTNLNRDNISCDISNNAKNSKPKFSTMCRICLMDENDDDNPLISPCKCTGSVRFVHLICMRTWLNAKTISKNIKNYKIYSFKNFECELCKTKIPGIEIFLNNS